MSGWFWRRISWRCNLCTEGRLSCQFWAEEQQSRHWLSRTWSPCGPGTHRSGGVGRCHCSGPSWHSWPGLSWLLAALDSDATMGHLSNFDCRHASIFCVGHNGNLSRKMLDFANWIREWRLYVTYVYTVSLTVYWSSYLQNHWNLQSVYWCLFIPLSRLFYVYKLTAFVSRLFFSMQAFL